MVVLRSLYRSLSSRSHGFTAFNRLFVHRSLFCYYQTDSVRSFFNLPSSYSSNSPNFLSPECRSPFSMRVGSSRCYSEDVSHMPVINDSDLQNAFKDLMAASWEDLPDSLIHGVKAALSKNTDDQTGKDIVANLFRAAEASEEFGGILTTLRMEIDDSVGLSGEDAKPMPDYIQRAVKTVYDRYAAYLAAFGHDETYLRKKVETELGTKMIHLKIRCGGLGPEWGKVSVLGTSGLSGSYVEQRA